MITKQITEIELHFDNYGEYVQYQEIYKKKGYNVTPFSDEVSLYKDWWFIAEKGDENV